MVDGSIEQRFKAAIGRSTQRSMSRTGLFRSVVPVLHDDVPTFMEAPHEHDAPDSDVIVFGFPYEGIRARDTRTLIEPGVPLENTLYARDGAGQAPDWIRRNALHYSLVQGPGLYAYELDPEFCVAEHISISDAGNLPIDLEVPAAELMHESSDRILERLGAERVPIILGGDDITPYVGLRTVSRQRQTRIAVIKFDAHFDLCWEPRYWAGSAWARSMEAGYLDPSNLAIIGVRGFRNPAFFGEVARELGVSWWTVTDVARNGMQACVRAAIERACDGADYLYLSFDVDVMDPAYLPAQKYPEPAGLTSREAVAGVRTAVLEGPPLCGADIDCLAPAYDCNGLGGQLAARLMVEAIAACAYKRAGRSVSATQP
ncbi:MAG: arginase family protein [Gammaproteobacteria bacterium]